MSKYQEALDILHVLDEHYRKVEPIFVEKYKEEPYLVIQELVDKTIPKNPIIKRVKDEFNGEFYDYPFCPICGECVVHIRYYCDNCGQRLE